MDSGRGSAGTPRRVLRGVRLGDAALVEQAAAIPPPPPPPDVPLTSFRKPQIIAPNGETPRATIGDGIDPSTLIKQAEEQAKAIVAMAEREAERARREATEALMMAQEQASAVWAEIERERTALIADADRLREEARAQGLEQGRAEGHAEGLIRGEREARDEFERETMAQLRRVVELADGAVTDLRTALRAAEPEIVRLALHIARRVIHRDVEIDRTIVAAVTEAAIQQITTTGRIRFRVHPTDVDELSAYWLHVHGMAEGDRSYEIVADPKVHRGGCVVETRTGTLDAQIDVQLDEIEKAFQ